MTQHVAHRASDEIAELRAALAAKEAELVKTREALREIAHTESGSRGAYRKLVEAVRIAQMALDGAPLTAGKGE